MQLKLFIAAALGLAANASFNKNAPEMKLLWNTWKQVHSKTYTLAEEVERFEIFANNYLDIVLHNLDKSQTYKKGLNNFSDLTSAEFKSTYASGLLKVNKTENNSADIDYSILTLPDSVDWRAKGAVTPVKNQKQCGSCWSFSTTGALEGLNFLTTGKLVAFSEQQLVDCDKVDKGCRGGLMDNAFKYVSQQGIQTEDDYPYTARRGRCQYDSSKTTKVNSGSTDVQTNNADALKTAITAQPVSIAIEADENTFQSYASGVITSGCGAQLDHGVLAVGYTKVSGQEAFIVKNSWSDAWGDKGYVMISTDGTANNGAGVCGILSAASFPTK